MNLTDITIIEHTEDYHKVSTPYFIISNGQPIDKAALEEAVSRIVTKPDIIRIRDDDTASCYKWDAFANVMAGKYEYNPDAVITASPSWLKAEEEMVKKRYKK